MAAIRFFFAEIYKNEFYYFRFDVTEAQFAVIGAYLFTALMGSNFWETPVIFSHYVVCSLLAQITHFRSKMAVIV